jgi:endonuclease-3
VKDSSSPHAATKKRVRPKEESPDDELDLKRIPPRKKIDKKGPDDSSQHVKKEPDDKLADKKWQSWAPTATSSPFPNFPHPTPADCEESHHVLNRLHHAEV